ncbi:MAG: FAD-dependent oxidoreductase, partial [Calditrichia bacterium]|nr:FAD-dependent oxidoreductase [Calditrichia bacterium]
ETLKYAYNSIVSVYIWTEKPIFHDPFYCLNGTKIQWIFNKRVYGGPYKSKYFIYQVTISAAHQFADETSFYIEKIILQELKEFFPHFDLNKVKGIKIIKEKSATPISNNKNEQNRNVNKNQAANWVMAGDWVQTDLPYTIESAAKSGLDAANYIINELFWD